MRKRDMGRDQSDAEPFGHHHHQDLGAARLFGNELGVPGKIESGARDHLLGDRTGGHGVDAAFLAQGDRARHTVHGQRSGMGVGPPRQEPESRIGLHGFHLHMRKGAARPFEVVFQHRRRAYREDVHLRCQRLVPEAGGQDFGTDPVRVSHRNRNALPPRRCRVRHGRPAISVSFRPCPAGTAPGGARRSPFLLRSCIPGFSRGTKGRQYPGGSRGSPRSAQGTWQL